MGRVYQRPLPPYAVPACAQARPNRANARLGRVVIPFLGCNFAEIFCPDSPSDSGSSWQAAPAGDPATIVSGTCDDGFYVADGAPYRGCDINGNWQTVQNPCQSTPIESYTPLVVAA